MSSVDNEPVYVIKSRNPDMDGKFKVKKKDNSFIFTRYDNQEKNITMSVKYVVNAIAYDNGNFKFYSPTYRDDFIENFKLYNLITNVNTNYFIGPIIDEPIIIGYSLEDALQDIFKYCIGDNHSTMINIPKTSCSNFIFKKCNRLGIQNELTKMYNRFFKKLGISTLEEFISKFEDTNTQERIYCYYLIAEFHRIHYKHDFDGISFIGSRVSHGIKPEILTTMEKNSNIKLVLHAIKTKKTNLEKKFKEHSSMKKVDTGSSTVTYNKIPMTITRMCNDTDYIDTLKKNDILDDSITYKLVCENYSNYTIGEYISEGSFNLVYELKDMSDKVIRITKLEVTEVDKEDELTGLFLQSYMSKSLDHGGIDCPYICKVYEFGYLNKGTKNEHVYAIIERVKYPSLIEFPEYNRNLGVTKKIIMQILEGLKCLHVNKYVHLDIKEENIGIDLHGDVKIIDFGFAKYMSHKQLRSKQLVMGTDLYIDPNFKTKKLISMNSDIYAVGIMLHNFTNINTISENNPNGELWNIDYNKYSYLYIKDDDYNDLKRKMMIQNPDDRITANTALEHPWFVSIFAQDVLELIKIMTPFIDMMYNSIHHLIAYKGYKSLSNVTKPKCDATNYTDISTSLANFLSVVYRCFNGLDDDLKKQLVFIQINEILSYYKKSKNPLYDLTKLINDKLQSTQCTTTNKFIEDLTTKASELTSEKVNDITKNDSITSNNTTIHRIEIASINKIKYYVDSVTDSITKSKKKLSRGGKPRRKKPSKTLRKRKQTLRKQTLRKSSYRKHRNI